MSKPGLFTGEEREALATLVRAVLDGQDPRKAVLTAGPLARDVWSSVLAKLEEVQVVPAYDGHPLLAARSELEVALVRARRALETPGLPEGLCMELARAGDAVRAALNWFPHYERAERDRAEQARREAQEERS